MYTAKQIMTLNATVFWVVTSRKKARRFGGTHSRHFHKKEYDVLPHLIFAAFLLGFLFDSEDEGDYFFRKFGILSELYRRPHSI
jgi:hypothetical protein